MVIPQFISAPPARFLHSKFSIPPIKAQGILSFIPPGNLSPALPTLQAGIPTLSGSVRAERQGKTINKLEDIEADAEGGHLEKGEVEDFSSGRENEDEEDYKAAEEEFSHASAYRARRDEKDYDRDPELADILGSCFDDPKKAQSKVEERIRRKRNKILHTKTGSATPMKIIFNKFDFSNSYIWFEFYNAPLPQDVTLLCDAIRAWYIIGRLGGCNSMNMQLSQSTMENKRPRYDAIMGANVTQTTFYNIGDLELQDNLARIWVDIGTDEPLLLDVLVNALYCISSEIARLLRKSRPTAQARHWPRGRSPPAKGELAANQGVRHRWRPLFSSFVPRLSYVGIKEVVFGGSEYQNWKENLSSEDAGYSIHKI